MFKKKVLSCISIIIVICMVLAMPAYASSNSNFKFEHKHEVKQDWGIGRHGRFIINKGILKGNGNGDYFWADYVKRGDIVVMIVRAFMLSTILGDNFPDVEKNSYYYDAIRTAKSFGIAKGDGKNFNPQKYVTIEQAIALIERAVSVANSNIDLDISIDLRDLYDGSLSNPATREQVAEMLYYILTGDITEEEDYDLDAIEYTLKADNRIKFDEDDFIDVLEEASDNDEDLDYVKFKLPSSTSGKLYYDYESSSDYGSLVKANSKYYADDDNDFELSKVTFVPYKNYSGTVSIEYTAFDEDGGSYTGIVEIDVLEADDDLDTIDYTTREDAAIQFKADDFSEALEDKNDEDLDYVKFKLPSSTSGKLYYDYESSSDYGSLVKATTEYYADPDDGKDLSDVSFVPYSNYTGTVSIEYTAFDEDGSSYTGIIKITVQEALDKVSYTTSENTAVEFDEEDFSEVLEDVSDKNLYYVEFTLPAYTYGKLYYDYESSSDYGSLVKATTKYYADPDDGKDLSDVSFVPYKNYTGTVSIKYTAFDKSGNSFNGIIQTIIKED